MHTTRPESSDDDRQPLPIDDAGYSYRDEIHFEETMTRIARERLGPAVFERFMGCFVIMGLVARALAGWRFGGAAALMVFAVIVGVIVAHMGREGRNRRDVETLHLCFGCGHPLFETPTDEDGWGRCPECGRAFNAAHYRRPPGP